MRLFDIMSSPVETIAPDETVASARERMKRQRIHHLVATEGKSIVGVLSERDLRGADDATPIGDLLASRAVVAPPTMTVRQAANLLRGHAVGCIPIVDGGKLVGIVTIADVLDLLGRGVQRPVETGKRWTLRHRGPRRRTPAA